MREVELLARLEQRLGRLHARQRLGIEADPALLGPAPDARAARLLARQLGGAPVRLVAARRGQGLEALVGDILEAARANEAAA